MILTKDFIADTSIRLIKKKGLDKVTVKDIVDACSMTRQTFYYHFHDIPDLLKYIVERKAASLLEQARVNRDVDTALGGFVALVDENDDFIRKLLNSRYHDLVDNILFVFLRDFLAELMENNGVNPMPKKEWDFLISYNAFAVKDILIYWRKDNGIETDTAISMVQRFIEGKLSANRPQSHIQGDLRQKTGE